MKIVEINTCNYGSTGNIMLQIAEEARLREHEVRCFVPFYGKNRQKTPAGQEWIGNRLSRFLHRGFAWLTGLDGMGSVLVTLKMLRQFRSEPPDVLHFHNLHGSYVNLPLLFRYVKKTKTPVVWTLHDCWSFTGQCPYFTTISCDKWETGCGNCGQLGRYPSTRRDATRAMWKRKKKWFSGVENLTIVTPSQWLADLVEKSYLGQYPVRVIHNGIDLEVFRPRVGDFRRRYHCENQILLLGVAMGWEQRKGLDVFLELHRRLGKDYRVALVGTSAEMDASLPEDIISIHRTDSPQALAEIYTAADLFLNPTREDNFPTVNMEALACGTPVITFQTGGSPEALDESCGAVVPCDDVDAMVKAVRQCTAEPMWDADACRRRAAQFDRNNCFRSYVELYELCFNQK